MGLFGSLKKEMYINKLVSTYKLYYNCGDMAAIECLRKKYSANELKNIMSNIQKFVGGKVVAQFEIKKIAPFKEDHDEVSIIDMKHGGN